MKNLATERVGCKFKNKLGIEAECIEYNSNKNIVIKFKDLDYTMVTSWDRFSKGEFTGDSYKLSRVGVERINSIGLYGTCIKYNNSEDIYVENKDTGEIIHTQWIHFDNGSFEFLQSTPTKYGGIHGGKYPAYINKHITKEYNAWSQMFRRCYDDKYHLVQPTYKTAEVSDEFMCYTNFYDYLHSQSNIDKYLNTDLNWQIDKDIVGGKGNKLYSKDTVSIVPGEINSLFTKREVTRRELNKDTPIGVHYKDGKFAACCREKHIGLYNTPEDAFYYGYKPYKENVIKQLAKEQYALGNITERCYDAMMRYEVEITD